ncbi:LOW QUALITY PROTEIN: mediator of RNA polymerase II transcription subunit 15 [Galleria mellonella]|uniref:Mediator of RNA polymerase II transcription subunit 15 n=1 Tax=Galleria mellonella TaxID=7137 RepID=A0ABM3N2T0_GALME|nr:LOW QUALITY PROTEIN: mediator of RNA polymerase II transcription subunit 15 [Galleria mellonella]
MDNNLKNFNAMGNDDWRTPNFRQGVVTKIEDVIQRSGMQVARNSSEMENHVFSKAKTREEYMNMIAKLILHVREMSMQSKPNQGGPSMQGGNQNQANSQVQNQQGQGQQGPSNQSGMTTDPINALQNLASQGSRNQMMNMGPQGQMQQQGVMGPNPGMGMQPQMGQQGPIVSQGGPQAQTATNLLQTMTQRPQMNMQMQSKLGGNMGMVPNQGQMGNNMVGGMVGMGNPMGNQLQNQLSGPGIQGQMMPNMSMSNSMQVPMSAANTMGGQMPCNQVNGGMGGQMAPNAMQGQMAGQMVGGMGNNQIVGMNMLHMQNRVQNKQEVVGGMLSGYTQARAPPPNQFLRQSPSPSAPSPNMGGPSPVSMGVMGGSSTMPSPMSLGALGSCGGVGGVGSPSPSAPQHLPHHVAPHQRGVGMGMVASPSSSLNTPVGAGVASPSGEEAAYKDKVRQLSKYIEPLRRMVHRMVSEGENVEKLTKMKNLLDILSNPNKRMPLETLIKCEVVLEKLDFRRGEGVGVGMPSTGKEQIFNPLLEVVNNCLQSPLSNHTLKRTFGSTLDALNGPEIKNLPPPYIPPKVEEPTMDIPDVLQGEIARLDSRFKVSLETMQLAGGGGAVSLVAALDDARLPCVPPLHVEVPRRYPAAPPARRRRRAARAARAPRPPRPPHAFLARLDRAMDARLASLPKNCSLGQLLDAWEMSVRQACAPAPPNYVPVHSLGL